MRLRKDRARGDSYKHSATCTYCDEVEQIPDMEPSNKRRQEDLAPLKGMDTVILDADQYEVIESSRPSKHLRAYRNYGEFLMRRFRERSAAKRRQKSRRSTRQTRLSQNASAGRVC